MRERGGGEDTSRLGRGGNGFWGNPAVPHSRNTTEVWRRELRGGEKRKGPQHTRQVPQRGGTEKIPTDGYLTSGNTQRGEKKGTESAGKSIKGLEKGDWDQIADLKRPQGGSRGP